MARFIVLSEHGLRGNGVRLKHCEVPPDPAVEETPYIYWRAYIGNRLAGEFKVWSGFMQCYDSWLSTDSDPNDPHRDRQFYGAEGWLAAVKRIPRPDPGTVDVGVSPHRVCQFCGVSRYRSDG